MHAIVNSHAAGSDPLRKLQREREIKKNVGLSGTTVCLNGVGVVHGVRGQAWGLKTSNSQR